jgi:prepilin-type N-terminal cleavage/methylation domain-containing protein
MMDGGRRQAGMTLVEILVALSVSSLILVAAVAVYRTMTTSIRRQQAQRLEPAHAVLDQLRQDLSQCAQVPSSNSPAFSLESVVIESNAPCHDNWCVKASAYGALMPWLRLSVIPFWSRWSLLRSPFFLTRGGPITGPPPAGRWCRVPPVCVWSGAAGRPAKPRNLRCLFLLAMWCREGHRFPDFWCVRFLSCVRKGRYLLFAPH